VVLTTHYMEEAAVLCDDIVIVDHGRIVARGTPEALVHSLGGDQLIEFVASPAIPAEARERVPGVQRAAAARRDGVDLVQALHEAGAGAAADRRRAPERAGAPLDPGGHARRRVPSC
jgi:ABC-2 type transport system ATP-binding protein